VSAYYFLAASLPALILTEKAPLSTPAFLELCARHMPPEDLGRLRQVELEPGSPACAGAQGLAGDYLFRELVLRNELARLRAQRLGLQGEGFARPLYRPYLDPEPVQSARRAFSAGDPLQCELELGKCLWAWLDSRTGLDAFGLDALEAYYVKLRLLERLALFSEEAGRREYDAAYRAVLDRANGVMA
jgi:hypothetical protein